MTRSWQKLYLNCSNFYQKRHTILMLLKQEKIIQSSINSPERHEMHIPIHYNLCSPFPNQKYNSDGEGKDQIWLDAAFDGASDILCYDVNCLSSVNLHFFYLYHTWTLTFVLLWIFLVSFHVIYLHGLKGDPCWVTTGNYRCWNLEKYSSPIPNNSNLLTRTFVRWNSYCVYNSIKSYYT